MRVRSLFSKRPDGIKANFLALILAIASAVAAHAQDETKAKPDRWQRIGISDGDTTSIDTQSIVRQEYSLDDVRVWVETRLKAPRTDIFGTNYTRHLARQTVDCNARTIQLIDWSTYTKNGSLAGSSDDLAIVKRLMEDPIGALASISISREIRPGSVAESVLAAVCASYTYRAPERGTGGGSGIGSSTGSANQVNYPPTPTQLFIPPLPMPDKVRGFHLVAEYDVDKTGKVLDFKFTPTRDAGYNLRLEEALRSFSFRPGTKPDGTPVRMKAQIIYDF